MLTKRSTPTSTRTPIPTPAPTSGHESVTARLERTVAPIAAELDSHPLSRSIADGTITKPVYSALLQSLLTMHRSFEHAITTAVHLKGFDAAGFRREEALARDLRLLGGHRPVRASEPLDQFESQVRAWARPPCAALIGALYAFERERKDAFRQARPLAAALRLKVAPRCGLDYTLDGAGHAARRFRGLQLWIDANARHPDRADELVEGARLTLQSLLALHRIVSAAE